MSNFLNTPIFSLKSKTTQVSLVVGLIYTLFFQSIKSTGDSVMDLGQWFGAFVINSFYIYLVLLIPFWLFGKVKKPTTPVKK